MQWIRKAHWIPLFSFPFQTSQAQKICKTDLQYRLIDLKQMLITPQSLLSIIREVPSIYMKRNMNILSQIVRHYENTVSQYWRPIKNKNGFHKQSAFPVFQKHIKHAYLLTSHISQVDFGKGRDMGYIPLPYVWDMIHENVWCVTEILERQIVMKFGH